MDLANLDSAQKTSVIEYQAQYQKLLTDSAAENASRQFNAKSVDQRNEFVAEIGTQVQNANSTRAAAMRQFNSDQANATERFVSQMDDSRDKFNANMVEAAYNDSIWGIGLSEDDPKSRNRKTWKGKNL